jgi:cation transport ATPase
MNPEQHTTEQHAHGSGHQHHTDHDHREEAGQASWRMAAQATLHCLTGCAIGEVLGMVIGTALGWSAWSTVLLAVVLAFVFGYALTMRGVLRAGVNFRTALKVALAADTVSIAVMEIVDNAVMLAVPGAMDAGLASVVFWASLAFALAVAFGLTTPVNRWLISRGKGHAVVHQYHHAH